MCVRGTGQPWRGAGAGGRYANIVRNFHVKNLQSGGGQAEPCHPAPATILSRDFQPAAQHRLLGGRGGGGGGGVQGGGGDWRDNARPGPSQSCDPHTSCYTITWQRCTAQPSTAAAAACKEGTLLIAPSFKEIFPNPELS